MTEHRRGDHVFNLGLRKTLQDLARAVDDELGAHGWDPRMSLRAAQIRGRVESLVAVVTGPAFDLTVQKPAAIGGDANSRQFGRTNEHVVLAFREFLTALRHYYTASDLAGASALMMLGTACLQAELAVSRWIDEAFDPEAAALATREDRDAARWIVDGQSRLDRLRGGFLDLIQRESPGRAAIHGFQ
jgi:hypothetical protein